MDPNGIVGQPVERDYWLAPDWSQSVPYKEGSGPPKAGWTRVSVRETLYNDGRRVREVLDENRQPIKTQALSQETDKEQEQRFQRDQANTQRQTDQSERRVVRVTYEGSGKDRIKVTRYETGPDKREADPEAEKPRKPVSTSYDKDGTKVTKYDDGTETREAATPAEARAVAQANQPRVTLTDNGATAILTYPDGRVETKPTGVKGKPDQVTVGGVLYEKGPDGTYKPAAGIPAPGAGSKNIETFEPDYTKPDLGLGTWAARQRQKIGLPADQGGITQTDYDNATKDAHAQATTALTNVTSAQNVQRQRALDEQNQRNTLSGEGADDYAAARKAYDATWRYANPNSDARFSTIPYLMQQMQRARDERIGTAKPMPALHPMFQWTSQATAATATPPNAIGLGTKFEQQKPPPPPAETAAVVQAAQAAPPPPPPAAAAAPVRPADPVRTGPAVGPGQIPVVNPPQPTLPPQAQGPNPAINPVTGEPTGLPQERTAPTDVITVRVKPEYTTAYQQAQGGREWGWPEGFTQDISRSEYESNPNSQYFEVINARPGASAPPNPGLVPDNSRFTGGERQAAPEDQGPFNPGPGEPGHRPGEPVGMAPGLFGPMAMKALGPAPAPVNEGPMNPALMQAAQQAQMPAFDPYQNAGRMVGLGIPAEAIAQAMAELGLSRS